MAIIRPGSHNRLHGPERNEALCLRVTDVDLINRVIRLVSHPLRPLKTSASRRLVPIPPDCGRSSRPGCLSANRFGSSRVSARETPWRGGRLGHRPIDALRAAAQAAGVACPGWHALAIPGSHMPGPAGAFLMRSWP